MSLLARGKRFGRWTSFWLIAHCGGITQAAKNYGNMVGKESCLNSNPATCQVMCFFFFFLHTKAHALPIPAAQIFIFWIRHIAFFEATLVIISNWNGNIYCWISGLKIALCLSFRWSHPASCMYIWSFLLFCMNVLCYFYYMSIAYVILIKGVPEMVSYIDFHWKLTCTKVII